MSEINWVEIVCPSSRQSRRPSSSRDSRPPEEQRLHREHIKKVQEKRKPVFTPNDESRNHPVADLELRDGVDAVPAVAGGVVRDQRRRALNVSVLSWSRWNFHSGRWKSGGGGFTATGR